MLSDDPKYEIIEKVAMRLLNLNPSAFLGYENGHLCLFMTTTSDVKLPLDNCEVISGRKLPSGESKEVVHYSDGIVFDIPIIRI